MTERSPFELPADAGRTVAYPDGGVVFIRGDAGDCAYMVRSGSVEIREAGRLIETDMPGEIFGEMALIDDGPRAASAVAVGPTELTVIDRATFDRLVRGNPDFAVFVMREMARRLRSMNARTPKPDTLPLAPRAAGRG